MTYCIGWKYNNTIFLVADSVQTGNQIPSTEYSSFGELHQQVNGYVVEEALLKIVPISENCVISFAGDDVGLAFNIIKHIKEFYATCQQDINEILLSVRNSLWPLRKNECGKEAYVELIIGIYHNNRPQLLKWNTKNPNHVEFTEDFCSIGCLTNNYDTKIKNMLNDLTQKKYNEDDLLAGIITTLQIYGMKDKLIEKYVGGNFSGIRITNQGVFWQKDITYIFFNGNNEKNSFKVTWIAKNDIIIVLSTKEKTIYTFLNSVNSSVNNDTIEKVSYNCIDVSYTGSAKYFVFVATNTYNAAIAKQLEEVDTNQFYSINRNEENALDIEIKPSLRNFLFSPAKSPRISFIK